MLRWVGRIFLTAKQVEDRGPGDNSSGLPFLIRKMVRQRRPTFEYLIFFFYRAAFAASKNIPLTTAFGPAVLVKRKITEPFTS